MIKEGAFGGTYFRDIYSGVNGKWYRKSWKEFDELKNIDQKYYCSNYYDARHNKYAVKCGTFLRFWENKGRINKTNLYGCFHVFMDNYFTPYWSLVHLGEYEIRATEILNKKKLNKCTIMSNKAKGPSGSMEINQLRCFWYYCHWMEPQPCCLHCFQFFSITTYQISSPLK